jgi:hypothetical protein
MAYKQKGWEAFSGAGDSPMKNKPQYTRKGDLIKHGRGEQFHKDNIKLVASEWGALAKHGLKNNPVVNRAERKRQRAEVKKTLRGAFKKTDPPKKKYPKHYTKKDIKFLEEQNEDIVRDEDKTFGQDIVKSVKDQIKDLEQDIVKLKSRNNPGDRKRIKTLESEINRLKKK